MSLAQLCFDARHPAERRCGSCEATVFGNESSIARSFREQVHRVTLHSCGYSNFSSFQQVFRLEAVFPFVVKYISLGVSSPTRQFN
ncbi:hypothetical protein KC19_VG126600 [Ceratodon purpureus]|uniref:Uncharacterized protein n=1 Tax=Ceratodon purpureus TaxID=3225 RepID=A0A8T0HPZ2_CERPU|nr:hypothetical protein KC19_VG126600 [Ceratodon purpureus]